MRMASVNNARLWQRFAYPADVQLTTSLDTAEPARVTTALAVDLSLGGVQLLAADKPELGSPVSCKFPGGQDPLTLRGYVRWVRQEEHAHTDVHAARVGVEFETLSSYARQVLQTLVSHAQRPGELVRVHLPNWSQPLQGVAVQGERGGVRLHVPLPCFVSGSTIKFEALQGLRELEGRVLKSELAISDETQGLELALALEPCEPTRKRRYMIYEDAPLLLPAPLPPETEQQTDHDEPIDEPVDTPQADVAEPFARLAPDPVAADPIAIPKRRRALVLAGSAFLIGLYWIASAAKQDSERRDAATARAAASTAAPPAPQTATEAPALPPPARELQPRLAISGDTTELFVPMTGALTTVRSTLESEPLALVIELPNSQSTLQQTHYELHTGGMSSVSIGKLRGVTQLRVYLSTAPAHYSTTLAAGGVTIVLKRAPKTRSRP